MTQQLLDEQIAARIKAECCDRDELQRFQRAVYIAETILEAYGLEKTALIIRRMRATVGLIPEAPPTVEPPPLPPPAVDPYTPEALSGAADPLTGRKRKKPEARSA